MDICRHGYVARPVLYPTKRLLSFTFISFSFRFLFLFLLYIFAASLFFSNIYFFFFLSFFFVPLLSFLIFSHIYFFAARSNPSKVFWKSQTNMLVSISREFFFEAAALRIFVSLFWSSHVEEEQQRWWTEGMYKLSIFEAELCSLEIIHCSYVRYAAIMNRANSDTCSNRIGLGYYLYSYP